MHTHTHTYTTCARACMHADMHAHTPVCACTCMHNAQGRMHTHVHTHMHTHTHTRTHTCTCTHAHAHTHIHTHTHTFHHLAPTPSLTAKGKPTQTHLSSPALCLRRPARWSCHHLRWTAGSPAETAAGCPGWSRCRCTAGRSGWGSRCWNHPRWWRSRPCGPWSEPDKEVAPKWLWGYLATTWSAQLKRLPRKNPPSLV